MITIKEVEKRRTEQLRDYDYIMVPFNLFDYSILNKCIYYKEMGRKQNRKTVNEAYIMLDTETSKHHKPVFKDGKEVTQENHLCAWTISIRFLHKNIVTLYGSKPSEVITTLKWIHKALPGDVTRIYVQNLSYDYTFLRRYLFKAFGYPEELNVKPHYPISIKFENGIELRDSLILFQRSLEKISADLNVEHKKAVGKWDYDKIRDQVPAKDLKKAYTSNELQYIEYDTLAGVECLDVLAEALNKKVHSMPFTATGIIREQIRKKGKENYARHTFLKQYLTHSQYKKATYIFHGGYTHANRHTKGFVIADVKGFDFSSSYPYCLLSERYPCEGFMELPDQPASEILKYSETHAFMFRLTMIKPRLKSDDIQMPVLQFSKCTDTVNPILDNGRVLCADFVSIYLNEIDLRLVMEQYDYDSEICTEVEGAKKDYLPRWLTDEIYSLYEAKCTLKGGDPVLYALSKSKLNSCYGMMVQKMINLEIIEDFETGEYKIKEYEQSIEEVEFELYNKKVKNRNTILNYAWGVWCTSYAMYNIHQLYRCCETVIYSDTDSAYGIGWNMKKVEAYNNMCKAKLRANGYGAVNFNGREYWLGVAESGPEDEYSEFKTLGSKRYVGRCKADNKLHLTVAGVPKKKGAECLMDDIDNFAIGFVFSGSKTGKLTHEYIYKEDAYIDDRGNEVADSINLTKCDYLLSSDAVPDWEDIFNEEVEIQIYEEDFKL